MMLRVTISGVESTGKSTLAAELAQQFGGILIPEFGRTYTELAPRALTLADHHAIAEGHASHADEAAALAPPLLVEDTDIVMTTAWATMLFGRRDPVLAARASRADLHFLMLPDVPFVADPVRMFGDDAARQRFHDVVLAEYEQRRLGPIRIGGNWDERRARAVAAIEAAIQAALA